MGCNGECPDGINRRFWENIINPTVHRLKKVCEKCNSNKNLDVHHNKYDGSININDLMLLCRKCHKAKHKEIGGKAVYIRKLRI